MIRLSGITSCAFGLIGGAIGTTIPMALEVSKVNSGIVGASVALGIGATSYALWHKYGQSRFVNYITKTVDETIKAEREFIQESMNASIKSRLPEMITSLPLSDYVIKPMLNSCIDNYATDPEVVSAVIEDLDTHVPYEKTVWLCEYVDQITTNILENKCTGCYSLLQPLLRQPLNRIVATVAANFMVKTTVVAMAKTKEYYGCSSDNAVRLVSALTNTNFYQPDIKEILNWGLTGV